MPLAIAGQLNKLVENPGIDPGTSRNFACSCLRAFEACFQIQ